MITDTSSRSSWISSIAYRRVPTGDTYLCLFTKSGTALLYSGVSPHMPGLLTAGTGKRSVGLAYNRLVKGKYSYQRVTDPKAVSELRRLMGSGVTP